MVEFQKFLAQILFWLYDFLDTIGAIFNILTGTQSVNAEGRTLLEVFVESAVSTKVLIALCIITVVVVGACAGVRAVKNIIQFKSGGEQTSHATIVKQSGLAILSSVACIFFVFMFIAFSSALLNMVNNAIAPAENMTLSQNLFNLSVEQSYIIDEDTVEYRVSDYFNEYGERVQDTDPNEPDGLAWKKDAADNYIRDEKGNKIPEYKQVVEEYHPYKKDADDNYVVESGWVGSNTAADLDWSYTPHMVFGVHEKNLIGMEQADKKYTTQPMVRLESFNLFTAYLVAIVMLISMFMLSIGLVKRIYDIVVLIICMPLVCGTIPLDDGARFRAWRETIMSKVLVAFGAVVAINVFYMLANFITGPAFGMSYLVDEGVLDATAGAIFKMLLLLGGAVCINGSQALVARILGTSADESREAMQSFSLISSGVRMGAVGALGAARAAMGAKRLAVGGTNRYGRETTGAFPMLFRGVNKAGEAIGNKTGKDYAGSRGAAVIRKLARLGKNPAAYGGAGGTAERSGNFAQPNSFDSLRANRNANAGANGAFSQPTGVTQPNLLRGVGEAPRGVGMAGTNNANGGTVATPKAPSASSTSSFKNSPRSNANGGTVATPKAPSAPDTSGFKNSPRSNANGGTVATPKAPSASSTSSFKNSPRSNANGGTVATPKAPSASSTSSFKNSPRGSTSGATNSAVNHSVSRSDKGGSSAIPSPASINNINNVTPAAKQDSKSSVRPLDGGLRTGGSSGQKSGAFKNDTTNKGKRG